jgi:UDP-2,3-diacylglucosamine pyrophosphatase LpxH
MLQHYRTGWISDLHLGTRGCQADAVLSFLRHHEFETLYVVGDLIDVWSLRRGIYWPQSHNDVLQKLMRAARKGTRIIYIPGNHDEFVTSYLGEYGNIVVQERAIHTTSDGNRLLIFHGHELDTVVQNARWLACVGDVGYQFLLRLNRPLNFMRRLFGLGYWSLSAYAKKTVKGAVNYVGKFEESIVRFATDEDVHGVLCGHIHVPVIKPIGGTTYYNCGDWVESCSAIVEHSSGRLELLTNLHESSRIVPLPSTVSVEEFEEVGARLSRGG